MISVEISWRRQIFMPERVVLVTDLDANIISVVQQWVSMHLDVTDPPLTYEQMLSVVGSLVEHISRAGNIHAMYIGEEYSDFVTIHGTFKNDYPMETVYIDLDSDSGVHYMIGCLEHYGPRTTGDGFMSYDPDGIRKRMKMKAPVESKTIPFEDVIDILEDE